ncbi:MAG TPA: XRE family transcriptional regulator [Acetobacteraceae bacterium]|nr:XRE family transcriptional regulator [Acetobacteraceae bacterium]
MIQDDPAPEPDFNARLAQRLRAEREAQGWSLAVLAERSGVSRAMISRVERGEASPTAALLGRLSGAFGLTLSMLLARTEADAAGRLLRAAHQPIWQDPATRYRRRALTPPGAEPELVEVTLPPAARVPFPAASYAFLRGQCLWVIEGMLDFAEGGTLHHLDEGDCLALGPPTDCIFVNPSADAPCRYLVALARR